MRKARGQCRPKPRVEGGKFCRSGINCRGGRSVRDAKNPGFIGFFAMARRLLIKQRGNRRPRRRGICRSSVMLLALGAASSVLDALKSLTSSKSSPPSTGLTQDTKSPFDLSGSAPASATSTPSFGPGAGSQISPATMSALLAAQSQSSTGSTASAPTSKSDALKDLFSQIDANGDGKVSKSEFENGLGAGGTNIAQADDVFGKMDKNGDGSVSLDEMMSALKGSGGKGHHHHHHVADTDGSSGSGATGGSSSDPLLQALQGASSTSTANSDGSTTTSLTYADGSKVTMTSPAATTASSTATSSYNFVEQMIAREAKAISTSATASLSVSA
jgi:hypothetical protein